MDATIRTMFISLLAITGAAAATNHVWRRKKRRRPEKNRSFYKTMTGINKTLRVDDLTPSIRTSHTGLKTYTPLWDDENAPIVLSNDGKKHITSKDRKLFFHYLKKYGSPYRKPALLGTACLVTFGIYEIAFAYTLKVIVNGISVGKGLLSSKILMGALLVTFPFVVIAVFIGERISARIASQASQDIRSDMFGHLQRLPVNYYKNNRLSDTLAKFSADMYFVRIGFFETIPTTSDFIIVTLMIAALFMLSWPMALISLVALPLLIYVLRDVVPPFSRSTRALKNEESSLVQVVYESVQAQPMIKSFSVQPFIHSSFDNRLNKLNEVTADSFFNRAAFERSIISALFLSQLFSVLIGLLLLGAGSLSVGGFLAFLLMQGTLSNYMRKLFRNRLSGLLESVIGIRSIDGFFQNQVDIIDSPHAIQLLGFHEQIRFDAVSFGYNKIDQQLKQASFSIEKGQFVAFVGPSGAGKSTIINLILRFYDACDGRILIDGRDIRDLSQASLRAQMGTVLQETIVFNASLFDNIRVAKPDATEAEVHAAAKAAELHDFVVGLPEGYQTSAGEAGRRLSGGQKQRIGIARALLCKPAILILDEATTSLDAETARAVETTISKLSKQCTVISISHHLHAVAKADKIFVLNRGEIVEEGAHDQLLRDHGLYAHLWRTQTAAQKQLENGSLELKALPKSNGALLNAPSLS